MAVSPFDSAMLAGLHGDPEIGALFTDAAEIRAMLRFEAALARAQAGLGMIPARAAEEISAAAETVTLDPESLAAGTARDGIVAPALVAAFRAALPPEGARWLHWGATSQDVIDTALVLRLRDALAMLEARIDAILTALGQAAAAHRMTVMAARTRGQIATPTTLGARIAVWGAPLLRQRERLAEMRPRIMVVSLAGASGTLSAMGERGLEVVAALARELGLGDPGLPWHAARDGMAELAGWLSMLCGALGKMGRDLMLSAQSELREVRAGQGGGSSTMPHKSNPVGPETLVALARLASRLVGLQHEAMLHEQERDGTALALEWHAVPQLCMAAGAATRHALALAGSIEADPARMMRSIADTNGLMLAEAATFALAAHMPRPEAQALVKAACAEALASGRDLARMLAERTGAPVDWAALFDPAAHVGAAPLIADRFVSALAAARG
ncbi:MAG: 3-carboxy-cis,cis-muconate cycloisomerase [Alphaproteobacteria bacterium]|nr:MAG: 3-carboxy-cis,cis-muconate cycloisomerase [Alphaproteobacteria bacterium]